MSQNNLSFQKLKELNRKFDSQLAGLKRRTENAGGRSATWWISQLSFTLFLFALSIVFPFLLLVRTSVYMYGHHKLNGWLSLAIGVFLTILLLIGYLLYMVRQYKRSWKTSRYLKGAVAFMVIAYTLYGLFYYSGLNTKSIKVRNYYRSLHPIMRVALSTVTLADEDIVVTDIRRYPGDYKRMNLSINKQSLHYVQNDGYVHAMDLRTVGRPEWKNWLTQTALRIVGLKTLRHKGTADHLHVYLPLND